MGLADSFSLSNIIVALAALFFLIGATLMSSPSAEQRRASAAGFYIGSGLIWLSLMNFTCTVLEMPMSKRYIFATLGSAAIGAFLVWIMSVIGIVPKQTAIADPAVNQSTPLQNCTGNCSFNQSGGTVIQNINQEPQRLKFDDQAATALLTQMMPKKPLVLVGIGSTNADQQVIQQYAAFFMQSGVQVQLNTIGISFPSPSQKITFSSAPDHYQLTLAPSAF